MQEVLTLVDAELEEEEDEADGVPRQARLVLVQVTVVLHDLI